MTLVDIIEEIKWLFSEFTYTDYWYCHDHTLGEIFEHIISGILALLSNIVNIFKMICYYLYYHFKPNNSMEFMILAVFVVGSVLLIKYLKKKGDK